MEEVVVDINYGQEVVTDRHPGDILGRVERVAQPNSGGGDGVGRLRLPPVVQHGHVEPGPNKKLLKNEK